MPISFYHIIIVVVVVEPTMMTTTAAALTLKFESGPGDSSVERAFRSLLATT